MATVTIKDAIVALLEAEIENIKDGAVPIDDFYMSRDDKYRFDVSGDEIKRYMRFNIRYRPCPKLEVHTK